MTTQVGTLAFRAPEFCDTLPDGRRQTYHRSVDIFSEGLTFLAILQARPPQSASSKPFRDTLLKACKHIKEGLSFSRHFSIKISSLFFFTFCNILCQISEIVCITAQLLHEYFAERITLQPIAEGEEKRILFIGQEMNTRKEYNAPDVKVVVVSQEDDSITKLIKDVIKGAIAMDPMQRLTAQDVLQKLNHVCYH